MVKLVAFISRGRVWFCGGNPQRLPGLLIQGRRGPIHGGLTAASMLRTSLDKQPGHPPLVDRGQTSALKNQNKIKRLIYFKNQSGLAVNNLEIGTIVSHRCGVALRRASAPRDGGRRAYMDVLAAVRMRAAPYRGRTQPQYPSKRLAQYQRKRMAQKQTNDKEPRT
ncbi:hypothetical protein GCM10007392_01620 [Saccharospirillum salsuginis]|uniref:Uncharacterized protein n=1 Tax=Saccharospirillum salsuginis TaxID=418750 RepID=A0A918N6A6_9GAMM|nr:hypothetical protein GCM10007392_01620 [Saccharospirillum salsuginis]